MIHVVRVCTGLVSECCDNPVDCDTGSYSVNVLCFNDYVSFLNVSPSTLTLLQYTDSFSHVCWPDIVISMDIILSVSYMSDV